MLSGVAVMLVLSLHNVAAGLGSLVNDGSWYIFIISRGPEQHFLIGTSSVH